MATTYVFGLKLDFQNDWYSWKLNILFYNNYQRQQTDCIVGSLPMVGIRKVITLFVHQYDINNYIEFHLKYLITWNTIAIAL